MYSSFAGGRQRASSVAIVSDPNNAYVNMEPHWELLEAINLGTFGIRKKHRKYLPQEPRELDESYDARLMPFNLAALLLKAGKIVGRHVDAQANQAARRERHGYRTAVRR